MNWPNLISLCRLFSVPLMIWLVLTDKMTAAFLVFLGAGFSDFLDGLLARLLKNHTLIGAYLDPLADKALLMGLTVVLCIKGLLPLWLVILIVFRDVLIISGALLNFVLDLKMNINPIFLSKINTFIQIIMVATVLALAALNIPQNLFLKGIFILGGLTTVLSGAAYVRLWITQVNHTN